MTKDEVIKYLKIERECISHDCDRNCSECDLVQEREILLEAYDSAIALIEKQIVKAINSYVPPWEEK